MLYRFVLAALSASSLALAAPGNYPSSLARVTGWSNVNITTSSGPTQTLSPTHTGKSVCRTITQTGTTSIPSGTAGACASVSQLAASYTSSAGPSATPTVPAQLAYECLKSIPFNQTAAVALLDAIDPYINWQTTLQYVKDPPAPYAQNVQAPYDFYSTWAAIHANTSAGAYQSEYDFGWAVYRAAQLVHDGHFVFYIDSVTEIFTFGRTTPLVSVSPDGHSAPQPFLYADILAASASNGAFIPSPIVQIDGQDAIEYLLVWSEYGSLQDPDALYNNLFYIPAQVALGPDGTGTGTFNGGGRGRFPYPGPTTTLTFANGSTITTENYARVLQPFDGIGSGEDVYQQFLAVGPDAYENAFQVEIEESTATSTLAAPTPSATSIPAPGYPPPFVQETTNQNSGYFLDAPGYEDVAVLAVRSFVGDLVDEIPFQSVNTYFIEQAAKMGKTKLIVDVSANGGGTILQGYDLFKQLFPSILPYGASRFRAHEAFNLLGEQGSYLGPLIPRSLDNNDTWVDIQASNFDYQTDTDVNYQPFTSWSEKYGPHTYGPQPDEYTTLQRWNMSDVLVPYQSGGIDISGYLNRTNITTQYFKPENIVVVYDGYCASTCTIFSELMRQQGDVKTIALGGRPSVGISQPIIQAVGGVKGVNDLEFDDIFGGIGEFWGASNSSLQNYWEQTVLNNYTQLAQSRGAAWVVNARDGIRQGDTNQVPLQFYYEPADCRILYTPAMVVDETAVWKTVADSMWGGGYGNACTAGDLAQGASVQVGVAPRSTGVHGVGDRTDYDAIFSTFDIETVHRGYGAGIMIP